MNNGKNSAARALAMGVVAALFIVSLQGTGAALSNSGGGSWQYYKEITITNSGGALSDYQVLVQLSSSNFPTNARSDGADIRFTDASGNELSYWLESWNYAGNNANVWVNVPSIPASGSASIRMYYGNPSASSSSNGGATFDFFDDFTGSSLDTNKWINGVGSNVVANGYIELIGTTTYGVQGIKMAHPPSSSSLFKTRARYSYVSGNDWSSPTAFYTSLNDLIWGGAWSSGVSLFYRDGVYNSVGAGNSNALSGWNIVDTTYYGNRTATYWLNNNVVGTASISQYFTDIILGRFEASPSGYSSDFRIDWFLIRKYASYEPTITLGAEQPVSTPTPTATTPSPTTPTPTPTQTTGTISVSSSTSGASIYLDGSYQGKTPKDITDVSVGSHYIELKLDGYKSWSDTIYVKASSTSYVSVPLLEATATITPTYTAPPTPMPTKPSVSLHGEKTDVVLGEDILLKLSAVNLITKPKMRVQVIIIPPSGMSVTSSEFSKSGAGQFTANYELEPGDGKDIEVRIQSNQVGQFNVEGRVVYYFGDDKDTGGDSTLSLPIKVREAASVQNPVASPAPKSP